jgi:16S rRNA (guanine1207-N2)-methyltransferase
MNYRVCVSIANEDAWELINDWMAQHASAHRSALVWIPQAEPCPSLFEALRALDPSKVDVLQSFKPFYRLLAAKGFTAHPASPGQYSLVLCVPTRQKIESLALIAQGILNLAPGGRFVMACANTQGSGSFISKLKSVVSELEVDGKNKCKWTAFTREQVSNLELLQEWIRDGAAMQIEGTDFQSVPGIYGWNKIDRGSELLASTLPSLAGRGADFGAGYGYLSRAVFAAGNSVDELHLIEADDRALQCATRNLAASTERCQFHWLDIASDRSELAKIPELDWIVMNPPFHEGRETEAALGRIFIETAALKIKPGGHLYMVANAFLSYEDTLKANFKSVKRVLVADGFKVIHAER